VETPSSLPADILFKGDPASGGVFPFEEKNCIYLEEVHGDIERDPSNTLLIRGEANAKLGVHVKASVLIPW
jgi:hypothetical protein